MLLTPTAPLTTDALEASDMAEPHSTLDHAPAVRSPETVQLYRENAARALRLSLWLALEAADRCGDSDAGDTLLLLYTERTLPR